MILAGQHVGGELLARFRAEAEAVARLRHPNIIQVYDVGEVDGCPFFSLEYVEGGSLGDKFQGTPQIPEQAAELISIVAEAMHAAHMEGIIHRDLKPGNILLTAAGQPKIADFGLAKQVEGQSSHTVSGSIIGTPSYMAPEQADGRIYDIGPRADVYAIGAILYEALTGRPPFRGASMLETLDQVRTQEPVPPTSLQPRTPRDLETICLKCLQKEPARRYESALTLAEDLRRFLQHEPILARSVTMWERLARWRRRNPMVAALVALSASLLISGLIITTTLAWVAYQRAQRIASINQDLIVATKESEDRGELALKTLEAVVKDIQTELANVPNAQKLRGRLLRKAKEGLDALDDKLRTHNRADRSTALALLNMAEVFRQVGDDSNLHGTAASGKLYEQAITIFERLHRDGPGNREVTDQLAEAYLLYGMNLSHADDTGWEVTAESSAKLKQRPQMQRALALHRQAADLRRQAVSEKPNDAIAQYELARALTEWAYQEVRAGEVETTRQILEEARGMLQQLARADQEPPAYRAMLAKCSERLGDLYYDMKQDFDACEPFYTESLQTLTVLAAQQPSDAQIQMAFANAWSRISDLHRARKDLPAALAASEQELAITQKLEKLYPDNARIMCDACVSYDHIFSDNYQLGNFERAHELVRRAFDIRIALIDADPDNRRIISQMSRTIWRLGLVRQKLNQLPLAVEAYETGLARMTGYAQRTQDHSMDADIAKIQAELEKCRKKLVEAKP